MGEVNCFQDLLVRVQTPFQRSQIANHLQGDHSLQCCEHLALGYWGHLDNEVHLAQLDKLAYVREVREDDSGCASLLDLKNIAEDLGPVLVIEDHEEN